MKALWTEIRTHMENKNSDCLLIAINPSQYSYCCDIPSMNKVLMSQNIKLIKKQTCYGWNKFYRC